MNLAKHCINYPRIPNDFPQDRSAYVCCSTPDVNWRDEWDYAPDIDVELRCLNCNALVIVRGTIVERIEREEATTHA